jgi:phosphoribosyl-dephospho-CoA transferase
MNSGVKAGPWLPHDLLQISGKADLICIEHQQCPLWVTDSLKRAPFVVVRRSDPVDRVIPIGIRGLLRSQRFAAYLRPESVHKRIAPEQLTRLRKSVSRNRDRTLPALKAWVEIERELSNFSLVFGPTGSVGVELVTGLSTTTAHSDLDLLFRVPERLGITAAQELMFRLGVSACRIDAQLETPYGAVSLAEYAKGQTPLLLRQNRGPVLVDDPWRG